MAKRITGIIVLAVLLPLSLASYWLLATTPGLRFVLDTVVESVPLPLTYTNLQGSIVSSIRADRAIYKTDSVTVAIDNFETEFSLLPLLGKRLKFSNVTSSEVQVLLSQAGEHSEDAGVANAGVPPNDNESVGLPIAILINQATIGAVKVSGNAEQPITFNNVSLVRARIRENFRFVDLAFERKPGKLSSSGELGFKDTAAVDMKVKWQTSAIDVLPAMNGESSLKGTYRSLQTQTHVTAPSWLDITASIEDLFGHLTWRAETRSAQLPLSLFDPTLATEITNLDLALSGTLSSVNAKATATIHDPEFGGWSGDVSGNLDDKKWKLDHLRLASLEKSTKITLQGESDEGKGLAFNSQAPFYMQATWNDLQWPNKGETRFGSRQGAAEIDGSLQKYTLRISDVDFDWQQYIVTGLNVSAAGSPQSLDVSSFAGRYLNGDWQGAGTLDWAEGVAWQVKGKFSNVDPSSQWVDWRAKLRGNTEFSGAVKDNEWRINGKVGYLAGTLRKLAIDRAAFTFSAANNDYRIQDLTFKSGNNRLQGAMQLTTPEGKNSRLTGKWDIAVSDLSQLLPDAVGEVQSRGTIGGLLSAPDVSLTAQARELAVGDYQLGSLELSANIDADPAGKLNINFKAANAAYQTWQLQDVVLRAKGTVGKHNIKVSSNIDEQRVVTIQAVGGYVNKEWAGKLVSTDFRTRTLGEWYQLRPVNLQISGGKTRLDKWCLELRKTRAQMCLMIGSNKFDKWNGKLTLTELPAAQMQSLFPQLIKKARGVFNGNAEFDIDGEDINTLKAALTSKQGMLIYGLQDTDNQQFNYQQLDVSLIHNGKGIAVNAHVDLQEKGEVTGNLLLKDKHTIGPIAQETVLDGHMVMDLNDLTVLHLIFPEVQFTEGRKYSEFSVSGSFGKPVFVGYSDVSIKSALLPSMGINLKNVKLRLDYDKQRRIKAKGHMISGDGEVSVEGEVVDYLAEDIHARLKVKGKNFQAANTAEITAAVSPDLTLELAESKLQLKGELVIPSANVKILDTTATVAPSSDVVMIDDRDKKDQRPTKSLSLTAEVRVTLGEFVRIQGFGAKGRLTGQVLVREGEKGVTTGSGEITIVDGKYSAYNQELVIEKGKLTYASTSIENPLVDIRAERKINDDVTVGVDVTGYAQNPKATLVSDPTMDDSDILSYMVLGYPISQATTQDGSVLASAAGSIGLVGGELLAKNIAKEFGIDEVQVQSDNTTQQTSLVLGKFLSPRLYAQYAVGIGQAVNAFRIEYQLTKQWVLKTETSTEQQGTDLLYSIER